MSTTHSESHQGLGTALMTLALLIRQVSAAAQEPSGDQKPDHLERVPLEILADGERHTLQVELAQTAAERRNGLMDRDFLAPDTGMLFVYQYPQPPQGGFWMYRTRIPLDIAFIDEQGRIAARYTMQPCMSGNPSDCPATLAGVTYHAALEVNAGYFEEYGIGEGACVSWPGRSAGCTSDTTAEQETP